MWWGNQAIFELNTSISLKRYELRPKLFLMANRKMHMRFRMTPRSMAVDYCELLKFEFSGILQIWEATTNKRMKIDAYCQRCNPLNVLFNFVFLALICRRFLQWDKGPSYTRCCRIKTTAKYWFLSVE